MLLQFRGEIWYWRGPSPFHFVTVPDPHSAQIESAAAMVTYGWGMIPVTAHLAATRWRTSLWPKDGLYLVPIKAAVRKAERVEVGDTVALRLEVED